MSGLDEMIRCREANARAYEVRERDRWRSENPGRPIPNLELYTTAPCPMCSREVDLEDGIWVCAVCDVQWSLDGDGAARNDLDHMDVNHFPDPAVAEAQVDEFNATRVVGTQVRYWPGFRSGPGRESVTRTPARLIGGHTPAVSVDGYSGGIALTHIEVIDEAGTEGPTP